jgi:hypothetical protein
MWLKLALLFVLVVKMNYSPMRWCPFADDRGTPAIDKMLDYFKKILLRILIRYFHFYFYVFHPVAHKLCISSVTGRIFSQVWWYILNNNKIIITDGVSVSLVSPWPWRSAAKQSDWTLWTLLVTFYNVIIRWTGTFWSPCTIFSKSRSNCISFTGHCLFSGIRRDIAGNSAVLGYYAASSGNLLPTFRDNLSVPSSGFNNRKERFLWILEPGGWYR